MAMDEEARERIHKTLVARRADQFSFLRSLVARSSENPPGDTVAHAMETAAQLSDLGLDARSHAVPEALCVEQGLQKAANVIVRREFGPGPTIALSAPVDTVPAGQGWRHDPFGAEIEDGVMFGRGVAQSKGSAAAYVFALASLVEAEVALAGAVELHLTYDGESGGVLGPKWLLEHELTRPDFAIGAGSTYVMATRLNGFLRLDVEIRGRAAPATFPDEGRDALEGASKVLSTLYAVRKNYEKNLSTVPGAGAPTLVIGRIDGGRDSRSVPDLVILSLDRRLTPEEDPAQVEAQLTNIIGNTVTKLDGVICRIRRRALVIPSTPLPGTEILVDALERNATVVLGESPVAEGSPMDSGSRYYAAAGIPTVLYGVGPRTRADSRAGRPEERLALDDLRKATEVVTRSLFDLLSPSA